MVAMQHRAQQHRMCNTCYMLLSLSNTTHGVKVETPRGHSHKHIHHGLFLTSRSHPRRRGLPLGLTDCWLTCESKLHALQTFSKFTIATSAHRTQLKFRTCNAHYNLQPFLFKNSQTKKNSAIELLHDVSCVGMRPIQACSIRHTPQTCSIRHLQRNSGEPWEALRSSGEL